MVTWDDTYREHGVVQHSVRSDVIEMTRVFKAHQRYERILKYKVLDHCSGTGRHTIYLAQQGFDVVGLDNSEEAIRKTALLCQGLGNVRLCLSEMDEIPFSGGYFSGAISILGIHFGDKDQRECAFRSLRRVMKKGSPLYFSLLSTKHAAYGLGDSVEGDPNTYTNIPDIHAGSRHFYDNDEIERMFPKFGFDIDSVFPHTEPLKKGSFFKYPLHEWRVLARRK